MALRRRPKGFRLAPALWALGLGLADAAPAIAAEPGQLAFDTGHYGRALQIWLPRARAGDPAARFGLGLIYDLGAGVSPDPAAAFGWYRLAARSGFAPAEFNVGVMQDSGVGTARNRAEAAIWYARAAAHGHRRAAYNLAQLYASGDGVPKNPAVAAALRLQGDQAPRLEPFAPAVVQRARFEQMRTTLAPPQPVFPADGEIFSRARGQTPTGELVWTAPAQSVPVRYYVEMVQRAPEGAREIVAGYASGVSVAFGVPTGPGVYFWRVHAVATGGSTPDYLPSAWQHFAIAP